MPKRQAHQPRRQLSHSNTYRFFVASQLGQGPATLADPELAHQLAVVLRLGPGDQVTLLDNSGNEHVFELAALERGQVRGSVVASQPAPGEPRTELVLYLALMRPERFEWALQKGTELGAARFVPLISEHTLAQDASDRKFERWQKIIREAAEQSRRGKLPALAAPQPFAVACEQASREGSGFLLWEGGGVEPMRAALGRLDPAQPPTIGLFSGPEGGFAESEVATARAHGIMPVTLGPRTLRAETAPLAAAAAVLFSFGDLD